MKSVHKLLEIEDLQLTLPDRSRRRPFGQIPEAKILTNISLAINEGESLGVVGESGSGKTSLGRTILRLHEPTGGKLIFQGKDITHLSEKNLKSFRKDIQMIFQDPQSSLNPRHRIEVILSQPLATLGHVESKAEADRITRVVLERVGLSHDFRKRYPHELSGGERQRIGIARAIMLRPKLIVADEIVSGLDVSAQARILNLLQGLKRDLNLALIFISHDLAVVRHLCDRLLVLRNGEVVESGNVRRIFRSPKSAYTKHLLNAVPLPKIEPDWLADGSSMDSTEVSKEQGEKRTMENKFEVSNCTALVTGANRGIGREFVNALVGQGARKVYACARNIDSLDDLITKHSDKVKAVKLDITNDEDIESAAGVCNDVNLLINNAGINRLQAFIAADSLSTAQEEMQTNYFGTLSMCRAFAPILSENGGGAIVNILSILARVNLPLMGSLCASKAAALSMTQGVRAELAQQGTAVLAVMPGAVDTDMSRDFPPPKMPPAQVAEDTLSALQSGEEELYCGDMASGVAQGLAGDPKAVEKEFAGYLPG